MLSPRPGTDCPYSGGTEAFVKRLAKRWGSSLGWPPSVAKERLVQRLSLVLQRANGRLFAAASAKARGGAEPAS